MTTTINYDHNKCAFTKSGWKVIFPTIAIAQDDDRVFNKAYNAAINSAKNEIMKYAEMISASKYVVGQWRKVINSSFSKETMVLHDLVMGNNNCDDLMFHLEVIDNRTIKVS